MLITAENEDLSNEFIIGGIIDKFFVQFELRWKVLKELLSYEGHSISVTGSSKMILKDYVPAFVKRQKGIEEYYGIELENL